MLKVLFIDIDNTLLSFTEYVKLAMKNGFQKFGLKPYQDEMFHVFEKINNRLWRQIEQNKLTLEELEKIRWDQILKELEISFDGLVFEHYFKEGLFSSAILEPHAMEMLKYLKSRYILCAASNGPYEQQLNRLREAGMYHYFQYFFISSQLGAQKPSREFFDQCFKILIQDGMADLLPEETMIIGDSFSSDMAGGIQYGMKTCLYQSGKTQNKTFPDIDHVISDLIEIRNFL